MPPVRSRENPRVPSRRQECMGQPAKGKGRRKRCNQSNPISLRRSQSPDMIASQPQMPSTLPEQNAPPAVRNASSVIEAEAVDPTVSFLTGFVQSWRRWVAFCIIPSQTVKFLDSLGAHIPNSLKNKIWEGKFIDLSLLVETACELHDDEAQGDILRLRTGIYVSWNQKRNVMFCYVRKIPKSPGIGKISSGHKNCRY